MKARGVPYLLVTNEMSSSVMADAAARVTGEVGVFSVVPGPGLTNAMTGIGEAFLDSVPIVGIITDVNRGPHAPIGQVHSLPNTALIRPIVKAVIEGRIADAERHMGAHIDRVCSDVLAETARVRSGTRTLALP